MKQLKIIQDKILDIQKNQENPEQLTDKEESKPQKTILVNQETKLNVLNEFSMQRFASKRISNVQFTLRVPTNLKNFLDVSVNFHGETEYGKAQGFGFFFQKYMLSGFGEIKNGMAHGTHTIYLEDQSYFAI